MERFVVREPRVGADYPQGNQMLSFAPTTGLHNNSRQMIPETMYFGGYGAEFPTGRTQTVMGMTHGNAHTRTYPPNHPGPGPNQVMSGIDPRYLAGFSDDNAAFIAGQRQQMQMEQNTVPPNGPPFANDYENRNFIGPERRLKTFTSQMAPTSNVYNMPPSSPKQQPANPAAPAQPPARSIYSSGQQQQAVQQGKKTENRHTFNEPSLSPVPAISGSAPKTPAKEADLFKTETPVPAKTRAVKLRELHKSGARAFSGPVEKVLKWHKALQDLGVFVLYEIVAKCVSIRPGERCAKNLVVRDDNGPAMQVVYYEIDFLLPELKPPCTVRVVGRMCPGTSRLQAFSVRRAAGDDVATLPRRAAVAAHHVAKLCKEYGLPSQ